jgi:uncharacterized protein (TIGR02246 family)
MGNNTSEQEVKAAAESWADAIRAKDFDRLMEHYTDDVVVFDVPPPLRKQGRDLYRESWVGWLGQFQGEIVCEFKDMEIIAGDEVAFFHTLTKIGEKDDGGSESGSWVRVTVGLRKTDGRWLATHEHASLPFTMGGEE